jgi:hypothetical protein
MDERTGSAGCTPPARCARRHPARPHGPAIPAPPPGPPAPPGLDDLLRLGDAQGYPLAQIGARLGLTRERVRQIERGASDELRAPQAQVRLRPSLPP